MTDTHCIGYFSVAIIKYSDKKQHKEEIIYFSLWFLEVDSLMAGKALQQAIEQETESPHT